MPNPVLLALQQQLAAYQRLSKLCEIQHEHVQHGQTEELLGVLTQRQHVLDQLAVLEQQIGPAKRRWSEYLAELPPAERSDAERLLAETRRLLEQITTADRNDALVLQQRKLNLGKEIKQHAVARQVNKTYATAAYGKRQGSMDVKK